MILQNRDWAFNHFYIIYIIFTATFFFFTFFVSERGTGQIEIFPPLTMPTQWETGKTAVLHSTDMITIFTKKYFIEFNVYNASVRYFK